MFAIDDDEMSLGIVNLRDVAPVSFLYAATNAFDLVSCSLSLKPEVLYITFDGPTSDLATFPSPALRTLR
ncbi:unannotated protein [freshwater metagenome]|uniref:Unannotated protein n=1 Tax=freshwater metagenome TaxID=449393 RepID=A0A6J6MU76_9ZZZZ